MRRVEWQKGTSELGHALFAAASMWTYFGATVIYNLSKISRKDAVPLPQPFQ